MVVQFENNVYLCWNVTSYLRCISAKIDVARFNNSYFQSSASTLTSIPRKVVFICTFEVIHTLTIHIRVLMILWTSYRCMYTIYKYWDEYKYIIKSFIEQCYFKNIISIEK